MTHPTLPDLQRIAEELHGANYRSRGEAQITDLLGRLLTGHKILAASYTHQQICFRARPAPIEGYTNISEMLYPPDGSPDWGRANLRKGKVLYAGWNQTVALDEIAAAPGEIVQLMAFRVRSGAKVNALLVGEVRSIANCGRSLYNNTHNEKIVADMQSGSPPVYLNTLFVDGALSSLFSRNGLKGAEYMPSAIYATKVMENKLALAYPSVTTPLAMNIAFPARVFDDCCEVIATALVRIKSYFGYGVYVLEMLNSAAAFDTDGAIRWGKETGLQFGWTSRGGASVPPDWKGWRVRERGLTNNVRS